MRHWLIGIVFVFLALPAHARNLPLHLIQLPPGFKISLFSGEVPNARSIAISPSDTVFVGSRHAGKVYALRDNDGDGHAERVYVLASGLNSPNGVAFHGGALYVAEINRILRFDDIEYHLSRPPRPTVISTDFPADTHHGWKFIRIGPDNKLYVPIGAPCNVCIEYGYAVITRLNLDGTQHEVYAEGVRNTVGFDWHPDSRQLWFTDNGRDMLGDDLPPDELNRITKQGQHFGFPHCHGGEVVDPDYGLGHSCKEYIPPTQKLGAHVASLGMRFYTGNMFPAYFNKQVFIAEHGSWNRSTKSGYRVSLVRHRANKAQAYEVFAKGWLQGEKAWGRPVDVQQMKDGSLLVSDDKAGAIYRIVYSGDRAANAFTLEPAIQKNTVFVPLDKEKPQARKVVPPQQTAVPAVPAQTVKTIAVPVKSLKPDINTVNKLEPPSDIHEKLSQQKARVQYEKDTQQRTKEQETGKTNEVTKTDTPPSDMHEKLRQQKARLQYERDTQQRTKQLENDKQTMATKMDRPPAELLEKRDREAEKNKNESPDPFAPVKKRVIEQ